MMAVLGGGGADIALPTRMYRQAFQKEVLGVMRLCRLRGAGDGRLNVGRVMEHKSRAVARAVDDEGDGQEVVRIDARHGRGRASDAESLALAAC